MAAQAAHIAVLRHPEAGDNIEPIAMQAIMKQLNSRIHIRALAVSLLIIGQAQAQSLIAIDPAAGPAAGINAQGDVILDTHIYTYSGGTLTPLGSAATIIWPSDPSTVVPMTGGAAINNNGETVGVLVSQGAYRANNGAITNLAGPVGVQSIAPNKALAINNSGVIAGVTVLSDLREIAFHGVPGSPLTTLVPPGGQVVSSTVSRAFGINDGGFITGSYPKDVPSTIPPFVTVSVSMAYIYDTGNAAWTDVGVGTGMAINATNQVTGMTYAATASTSGTCGHAFLYSGGTMQDIGTLGGACSTGLALNDSGLVVGSSQFATGNSATHAFLFNGALQDINDMVAASDPLKATVTLTEARGINANGLVVANGFDSSNPSQIRAYLLQVPAITFGNGVLDFGSVAVNTTSLTETVTVTNNGIAPVAVSSIAAVGEFTQTNNCGASLAAGASCTFNVAYAPVTAGEHRGGVTMFIGGLKHQVIAIGDTPLEVSMQASSANVTVGVPFTLSWTATAGATCNGLGGESAVTPSRLAWIANKPATGSMQYTSGESGNLFFSMRCTAGSHVVTTAETTVNATWPPVTASISATPSSVVTGSAVAITWDSANASSCAASGGTAGDTWTGARATSGTATITPAATTTPRAVAYTITCMSLGSGLAGSASVTVNQALPAPPTPPPSGGGGGSMDLVVLAMLGGLLFLLQIRRRDPRARVNEMISRRSRSGAVVLRSTPPKIRFGERRGLTFRGVTILAMD